MSDEPDCTNIRFTPREMVFETLPTSEAAPHLWQALRNAKALCAEIEKVAILDDGAERDARLRLIGLAAKGLTLDLMNLTSARMCDQREAPPGTYVVSWPKAAGEDDC